MDGLRRCDVAGPPQPGSGDCLHQISEAERGAQVAAILTQVERGTIPIGGFISPGEREVATEVAKMPRARIIKLIPWGLMR